MSCNGICHRYKNLVPLEFRDIKKEEKDVTLWDQIIMDWMDLVL